MLASVTKHFLTRFGIALTLMTCLGLGSAQSSSYYPNQVGTYWTYTSGEIQVVGSPVTYKDVKVTPISHQYGGKTYSQDLMEYRSDGSVWLRGINSNGKLNWYNPPLNVYPPAPLTAGKRWTSFTKNLQITNTVVGNTPIKNSAGTFNAIVIRSETNTTGRISVQMTYFVPSIGIVRYETADGSTIDLIR